MHNNKGVSLNQQKFMVNTENDKENNVKRRKNQDNKNNRNIFNTRLFRDVTTRPTDSKVETSGNGNFKYNIGKVLVS